MRPARIQVQRRRTTKAQFALRFGWLLEVANFSVFRRDPNLRASTVLVPGGTGLQPDGSVSTLAWTRVPLILLVILAAVIVSERVSARIRHVVI